MRRKWKKDVDPTGEMKSTKCRKIWPENFKGLNILGDINVNLKLVRRWSLSKQGVWARLIWSGTDLGKRLHV
jgi:hypothetical protein